MAIVHFSSGLRHYTGGIEQIEVEPGQIRAVMREVTERFPEIKPPLAKGIAVSIDGDIIHSPLLEPVGPDSEVHFLPQVSGGTAEDDNVSG